MTEIFVLALAILLASILAIVMRRLKQPLVVSYVLAGAVLSVFGLVKPEQLYFLKSIPEIGLAFLLFLIGMELDLNEFKSFGKKILITSAGQVLISSVILTAILSQYLSASAAFLIAVALSFSSTILVVKLLIEKNDLSTLHGKTAIGILLVEDLLAILILMVQAIEASGSVNFMTILVTVLKGGFIIWLSLFSGRKILPKIFKFTTDNTEILFLTAITWCLLFVSLSLALGFSTSIGAFLAGISLAQSAYRVQISGKIKPLRDFFIMLFFINLGTQLSFSAGFSFGLAITLVFYMAIGKPVLVFLLLIFQRFRVRPAFQTAILLSSISEFSLIILFTAVSAKIINQNFVSPMIFAVILSFIISSFLITHSKLIYKYIGNYLKYLERKNTISFGFLPEKEGDYEDHAILIGCHRSGQLILKGLKKIFGDNLIVVDFNPDVIEELKTTATPCLYGDTSDPEIIEKINPKTAKIIVSTARNLADNLALLDTLEKLQSKAIVIITADDNHEAIVLYERGAHHVSLPMNLEGNSISHLIYDHIDDLQLLAKDRERKLGELKRNA